MLSDKEKEGCKTILNKLPQQDLITLTDTVTNRLVAPENASGKINYLYITVHKHTCSSFNMSRSYLQLG